MKLIHITDPHIVPPPRPLCGLDPRARLTAAVDDINHNHGDAAFAVMTGDLAYRGTPGAYRALRDILDGLRMPCHLLVGNHDHRGNFQAAFPGTPRDARGFVQYVVETPAGCFVMMDTMEAESETGIYCDRRFEWLGARLAEAKNRPVFLFMHHPPFDIGIAPLDASRLADSERLFDLIAGHGSVRHLFYGHVHRAVCGSWRGIPASALPGTNHQVGLTLGGTAEMLGTHEPPAYGVVLIEADRVVVHLREFLDRSPRFPLLDPASKSAPNAAALPPYPAGG